MGSVMISVMGSVLISVLDVTAKAIETTEQRLHYKYIINGQIVLKLPFIMQVYDNKKNVCWEDCTTHILLCPVLMQWTNLLKLMLIYEIAMISLESARIRKTHICYEKAF